MNVLLLTNHLNTGGITVYLYNLCRALQGQEDIRFWIGSRGGEREKDFQNLGVRCVRLPLTTKCELSPKVFFSFFKLRSLIKDAGIDLLHAQTRVTQVLCAMLSQATGKPYMTTCHGYFRPRLTRRLWPCWGKKIIAISDPVASHLERDFGVSADRIALIYNGIDISATAEKDRDAGAAKQAFGLDPRKKVIGHIGRLSSVKGQKYFVLAASLLAGKRSDCQFLLIGEGDEKQGLEELIRREKLEGRFVMRPGVARTAQALAAMDVFVMPSLQEGLGFSILEAQANGVPVAASRVGGIPAVIQDGVTGLLSEAKDAAGLAANIERLLDEASLRSSIIEASRRQITAKFSARRMADQTRRVYQTVT